MNRPESDYYEYGGFWDNHALEDEGNMKRILLSIDWIPQTTRSLIDIGCGNGVFSNTLMKLRNDIAILSVDRSASALRYVNTRKLQLDILDLSKLTEKFECVTCFEVIEHLTEPTYEKSLEIISSLSEKYILISVPYNEKLTDSFTMCPNCKSQFSFEMHLRSFNKQLMDVLLEKYNFKCKKSEVFFNHKTYFGKDGLKKLYKKYLKRSSSTFLSPICPICGYNRVEEHTELENNTPIIIPAKTTPQNSYLYYFKKFWPKVKKDGYWIIALYERN
jgi:hypothetical protein